MIIETKDKESELFRTHMANIGIEWNDENQRLKKENTQLKEILTLCGSEDAINAMNAYPPNYELHSEILERLKVKEANELKKVNKQIEDYWLFHPVFKVKMPRPPNCKCFISIIDPNYLNMEED